VRDASRRCALSVPGLPSPTDVPALSIVPLIPSCSLLLPLTTVLCEAHKQTNPSLGVVGEEVGNAVGTEARSRQLTVEVNYHQICGKHPVRVFYSYFYQKVSPILAAPALPPPAPTPSSLKTQDTFACAHTRTAVAPSTSIRRADINDPVAGSRRRHRVAGLDARIIGHVRAARTTTPRSRRSRSGPASPAWSPWLKQFRGLRFRGFEIGRHLPRRRVAQRPGAAEPASLASGALDPEPNKY
jgi:hypothetical protein